MTSKEFTIWLKGFVAGSNNYNLTPAAWDQLKKKLESVNDDSLNITYGTVTQPTFTSTNSYETE
jgi:hypothetical protein